MTKLEHDLETAVRSVDPSWDGKDTEIGLAMLRVRVRRRATARRASVGVAAVMACAGLAWGTIGHRTSAPVAAVEPAQSLGATSAGIRFSDGSVVTRLEP